MAENPTPHKGKSKHHARDSDATNTTNMTEQKNPTPHKSKSKSKSKHSACDSNATNVTNVTEQTEFATFIEGASGPQPKKRPAPLDLTYAIKFGENVQRRKGMEAVHNPVPAPLGEVQYGYASTDGGPSSSVYSSDSPRDGKVIPVPLHILESYNAWKEANSPRVRPDGAKLEMNMDAVIQPDNENAILTSGDEMVSPGDATCASLPAKPVTQQSKDTVAKSVTFNDLPKDPETGKTDNFTPLTPWLLGGAGLRKATKVLFGNHGWLQDTAEDKPKLVATNTQAQKPTGFFVGLKKLARDLADMADMKPGRRMAAPKRVTISLDPREQSLLYCELEFILSNALDTYIKSELNSGRLDPAKLKKVSDAWAAQGRPRVVGFRYDLETQIQLVELHATPSPPSTSSASNSYSGSAGQFRFYGMDQLREGAVAGLLGTMRANARAMRVRTLCQPDSVIAKHVLDAQALLQLIGAAEGLHISLAEVSQFFKVVLERERAVAADQERKAAATAAAAAAAVGGGAAPARGGQQA